MSQHRRNDKPRRTTLTARRLMAGSALLAAVAATAFGAASQATATPSAHHITSSSRSHIPWSKVGSGWTLATWAKKDTAKTQTLYLVAPNGDRYDVRSLPRADFVDQWSPDGKRATVEDRVGYIQIDLRSGHAERLKVGRFDTVVSYSRPTGLALLDTVWTKQGGHEVARLERFTTSGRHEGSYPSSAKGAGDLNIYDVQETADGSELVLGAQHGLEVLRNNGTTVRHLAVTGTAYCRTAGWLSRNVTLATCGGNNVLYSVPLSGAKATRLTDGATKENPFGYDTLWTTSNGRYGLAENGCGPDSLVKFDGKHGVRFTPPSPTGKKGTSNYVGHSGTDITLDFSTWGCQASPTTLFRYSTTTHKSTALLGPKVNGGSVTRAIAFPSN